MAFGKINIGENRGKKLEKNMEVWEIKPNHVCVETQHGDLRECFVGGFGVFCVVKGQKLTGLYSLCDHGVKNLPYHCGSWQANVRVKVSITEGLCGQLPGCDHGVNSTKKKPRVTINLGGQSPGSKCLYNGRSWRATAWV